ncbi:hypothetical protein ALQ35_04302 [Pseudomonas fluorescens]|nr:hypothetical protein ALQ35_04302 [Pseudomonas fluorescens]
MLLRRGRTNRAEPVYRATASSHHAIGDRHRHHLDRYQPDQSGHHRPWRGFQCPRLRRAHQPGAGSVRGADHQNTPWVRLSAIIIGLALGSLAAWFSGKLVPQALPDLPLVSLPIPFRFGFNFDWSAFLPIALIYLISSIETVGDLTANCMIARQPISGPSYISRLKGGVLGDGVSCMIAATFSAFPNTTFAQNNGVIQLTGVASRYVGLYIGVVLCCLGLFPLIGAVLQQIPKPVLGGATLVMFGSVAAAGVRILAQAPLDRRSMLIIATSFGVGLGIAAQPNLLHLMPPLVQNLFDSAITSGGLTAIVLCLLLPEAKAARIAANHAPESDTLEPL